MLHVHAEHPCSHPCSCPCSCRTSQVCMCACVLMCKFVFVCVFVFVCINAGMPDCLASNQSGTRMKKLTMPGQVWYQTKPRQSSIFLVLYRTEIIDAGMPMLELVFWVPMPSYAYIQGVIRIKCTGQISLIHIISKLIISGYFSSGHFQCWHTFGNLLTIAKWQQQTHLWRWLRWPSTSLSWCFPGSGKGLAALPLPSWRDM